MVRRCLENKAPKFVRPSNRMMTTTFPSRITCWWWNRHCHGVFSCGWTARWQLEMTFHRWCKCDFVLTSCWQRMTWVFFSYSQLWSNNLLHNQRRDYAILNGWQLCPPMCPDQSGICWVLPSVYLCNASIDLQQISFPLGARHIAVAWASVPLPCGLCVPTSAAGLR